MKKLLVLGMLALTSTACTMVPPGYVGIKVNSWGSQRGVEDFPIRTGRVMFNPFTTDVYQFPTFLQRENWAGEQTITCRSKQGQAVGLDVAVAYTFQADKVPTIFVRFRQDPDTITATYIRDQVRGAMCGRTEHFDIMEILGDKLSQVATEATKALNDGNKNVGIVFDYVNVVGKPHVDAAVDQSINNVITAIQNANAAKAKVEQAKAEAQQEIERAEGQKKAEIIKAEGAAEANRIINQSLNNNLIQWRAMGKWDGRLPQVTSGATPLLNLGKDQ